MRYISTKLITCLFFSVLPWLLPAQTDTLQLKVVEIEAINIRTDTEARNQKVWNHQALKELGYTNLAELLSAETGSFIKSYGQGSLATSSIRGGSAGQSLILWNGLPISSPMLGQLDLSLLPLNNSESIQFQKGGNSALWGSGAIGGLVSLQNQAEFENKLLIDAFSKIGSFGRFEQNLQLGLGNRQFQSRSKVSYLEAKNDFSYFLADGLPERVQTNASIQVRSLQQDLYWKPSPKHQLSLNFWTQDAHREIPPTNVQNRSEAHQEDNFIRSHLSWKYVGKKSLYEAKAAYFDEELNYFNDLIGLESRSHFKTLSGEISGQWSLSPTHRLHAGSTLRHTRAWSGGYQFIPDELRNAAFVSWLWQVKRLRIQSSLRQEIVDGKAVPLLPILDLSYQLLPAWSIRGKVSKNYRLPTFNDRYWAPGGNPDLLPESGWSGELGIGTEKKNAFWQLTVDLTAFNRRIDNWIMWGIAEGQSFWSANNITRVWSRGLEPRIGISHQRKEISISAHLAYDYILSTSQAAIEAPRIPLGSQLFYTPVHQAQARVSFAWKSFSLRYTHLYTGKTTGINENPPSFQLGNVHLQFLRKRKSGNYLIFFQINNIWDLDYQVIERRPMPGIHYQMGINFTLNKNQSK
ncbi:MAG: TonB-dependent receptor [Bacteroidia bacterium]|nr:TonB-dependent receptor [Bacteroidia bacterium]